ncbi:3-ketoacyl-CoA thiolase @ Acetyl-CoA acetyltransferase [hydrothermal vent metagenome]|uniref:3-ketoacyl-CoA thiolase @ Acetyl-CoA acetyltransferase n=1 Tax=hydrothermal vent metagenome TaxID=652676 RepID=A0A3B0ZFV2_9ZZZZ
MAARKKKKAGGAVYIVDGSRTPFLKVKGSPGPFLASDLAVAASRPLLARQPFEISALDEVIVGCVMPTPDEVNVARIIALRLGCDESLPAWTVQRNCASGLQALDCAYQNIKDGRSDLVLAGGAESMSHAPVLLNDKMVGWLGEWAGAKKFAQKIKTLGKLRGGHLKPIIGLLRGLSDPVIGLSMGQTAENLAYRFGISRETMDAFAVDSHKRLIAAQEGGYLEDEIEAVYDSRGNSYQYDDGARADSSVDKLGKLRPVFDRKFGKVTAGNSAQITDGAAMLLLASEHAVEKYDLKVMGRIVDSEWAGLDPAQMGLGPVHAMAPILKRQKMALNDIDYWEVNEAFATQVLACVEAWQDEDYCKNELGLKEPLGKIDRARLNVDGGGVSLGHPVGASGARIVLHILNILERNDAQYGMASLCIGGGQGGAMLVSRDLKGDVNGDKG